MEVSAETEKRGAQGKKTMAPGHFVIAVAPWKRVLFAWLSVL